MPPARRASEEGPAAAAQRAQALQQRLPLVSRSGLAGLRLMREERRHEGHDCAHARGRLVALRVHGREARINIDAEMHLF